MKKTLLGLCTIAFSAMSALSQTNPVNNSGLDSWNSFSVTTGFGTSISLEAPVGWSGSDSLIAGLAPMAVLIGYKVDPAQQIFETNIANSGTSAAMIVSTFAGDSIGVVGGVLSNGQPQINIQSPDPIGSMSFAGGTIITERIDTVSAWILLADTNTDNASISVMLFNNDDPVGEGLLVLSPSYNQYTQVHIPISYTSNDKPNRLVVSFASSVGIVGGTEGNTLLVDDVSVVYAAADTTDEEDNSIRQLLFSDSKVMVYPNPAQDLLHFNLKIGEKAEGYEVRIYDMLGREVYQKALSKALNTISLSEFAKGNYMFVLTNKILQHVESGKIVVE